MKYFKLTKIFLVSGLFLFCMSCSCSKKEKTNETGRSSSKDVGAITNLITIQKGTKLTLDSPKKFVELWILYNIEQKKWFEEIANDQNIATNEDKEAAIADILEEKKKQFYSSFGITERDFVNYSMNNMKKIQAFLEENPEYKKAYEKSMD